MNGKWISIVSLILAVLAIVMAVGIPVVMPAPEGEVGPEGPQGPAGPQGPQGLSGPGAIIETGGSGDITPLESVCTHYNGAEVTISVPSNGTIVVTAQIQILINHTYGVEDSWRLVIGESPTDCATSHVMWRGSISSNSTTDADADRTGAPMRVFIVTAGTFTYYTNGYMVTGQDSSDVFWYGYMVAVFYPS